MNALDLAMHLLNFAAPAWGLALALVLSARVWPRRWLPRPAVSLPAQVLIQGLLGTAVLLAGLVLWEHDGKMATYGALVAVAASTQWGLSRAWRG